MNEDTAARETAREQEFVDGVYRQLVRSAASAQALAREGHSRGRLGHEFGWGPGLGGQAGGGDQGQRDQQRTD